MIGVRFVSSSADRSIRVIILNPVWRMPPLSLGNNKRCQLSYKLLATPDAISHR